jgi:hypothetical protein
VEALIKYVEEIGVSDKLSKEKLKKKGMAYFASL